MTATSRIRITPTRAIRFSLVSLMFPTSSKVSSFRRTIRYLWVSFCRNFRAFLSDFLLMKWGCRDGTKITRKGIG